MSEREKYLIDVKNVMLWHFDSVEIKDTLKKLDAHFKSSLYSGISEEEIINECGKPKEIVNKLQDKVKPVVGKREKVIADIKERLFIAYIFGICTVFCLSFIDIFSIKNIAFNILATTSPTLLWFLFGNNYLIDILSQTQKKHHDFIKSQVVVFSFAIILNLCLFFVVPHMLIAGYINGPKLLYFINFTIALLFFMTALYLRKMLQGNLYMFLIIAQNISLILGIFLYISFIYNIESLENMQFVLTQYFISLIALIPYYVYIYKKGRNN